VTWRRQALYGAAALLFVSPIAAPQLLAFPHSSVIGQHAVYSEAPITPRLTAIVDRADALAGASPIALPQLNQPIFFTDGGWRRTWLALTSRSAFAISRPLLETIVVNRSAQSADEVYRPAAVGGRRTLSGTLAHEMTHGAIRAHFGALADFRYPGELREGYCDYVAGGGSLSDPEAARLTKSEPSHPALKYWRGRKEVELRLKANRGDVDRLFAGYRT